MFTGFPSGVLRQFIIWLIAVTIIAGVVKMLLMTFVGFDLGPGSIQFIPIMAASIIAGNTWGRLEGNEVGSAQRWRFAIAAGAIYFALQITLLIVTLTAEGLLNLAAMPALILITFGLSLLALLGARIFIGFGIKNGAQSAAK